MKISERGLRIIFIAFLNGDQCHFLKTVLYWKNKHTLIRFQKLKRLLQKLSLELWEIETHRCLCAVNTRVLCSYGNLING